MKVFSLLEWDQSWNLLFVIYHRLNDLGVGLGVEGNKLERLGKFCENFPFENVKMFCKNGESRNMISMRASIKAVAFLFPSLCRAHDQKKFLDVAPQRTQTGSWTPSLPPIRWFDRSSVMLAVIKEREHPSHSWASQIIRCVIFVIAFLMLALNSKVNFFVGQKFFLTHWLFYLDLPLKVKF